MVFVRDDLPRRRLVEIEINQKGIETICLEITIGSQKTVFACVYKHPFLALSTFKDNMCSLIDRLFQISSDVCVFGDSNCCPKRTNVIKDLCDMYGLHNLITKPTCFKGEPTAIDVILVSNKNKFCGTLNCESHVSDFHSWIGASTRRFAPSQKPSRVNYRFYKKFDENAYCSDILSAPFLFVKSSMT